MIDIPPVLDLERRGTITMGFLDETGELPITARVYQLTGPEEQAIAKFVSEKVRAECGPSFL